VIDLFLDEESQQPRDALGDFIGKPISLQVETLLQRRSSTTSS
jgi:hypothetical protein